MSEIWWWDTWDKGSDRPNLESGLVEGAMAHHEDSAYRSGCISLYLAAPQKRQTSLHLVGEKIFPASSISFKTHSRYHCTVQMS